MHISYENKTKKQVILQCFEVIQTLFLPKSGESKVRVMNYLTSAKQNSGNPKRFFACKHETYYSNLNKLLPKN